MGRNRIRFCIELGVFPDHFCKRGVAGCVHSFFRIFRRFSLQGENIVRRLVRAVGGRKVILARIYDIGLCAVGVVALKLFFLHVYG